MNTGPTDKANPDRANVPGKVNIPEAKHERPIGITRRDVFFLIVMIVIVIHATWDSISSIGFWEFISPFLAGAIFMSIILGVRDGIREIRRENRGK